MSIPLPAIAPSRRRAYTLSGKSKTLVEADLTANHSGISTAHLSDADAILSYDRICSSQEGRSCEMVTLCTRAEAQKKIQSKYDAIRKERRTSTRDTATGQVTWVVDPDSDRGQEIYARRAQHEQSQAAAAQVQRIISDRRAALVASNGALLGNPLLGRVQHSSQRFTVGAAEAQDLHDRVKLAFASSSTEVSAQGGFSERPGLIAQSVQLESALRGLESILVTSSSTPSSFTPSFLRVSAITGGTRPLAVARGPGSRAFKEDRSDLAVRRAGRSLTGLCKQLDQCVHSADRISLLGPAATMPPAAGGENAEYQTLPTVATNSVRRAGALAVVISPANVHSPNKLIMRVATSGSIAAVPSQLLDMLQAEYMVETEVAHDRKLAQSDATIKAKKPPIRRLHPIPVVAKEVEMSPILSHQRPEKSESEDEEESWSMEF